MTNHVEIYAVFFFGPGKCLINIYQDDQNNNRPGGKIETKIHKLFIRGPGFQATRPIVLEIYLTCSALLVYSLSKGVRPYLSMHSMAIVNTYS